MTPNGFSLDSDTRRLERRPLERNGEDVALGRTLFRCADDFRQLRFV
jgi:hypothetical protein